MGEGSENQLLQGSCLITQYDNYTKGQDRWMINEGEDDGDDMYDTSTESTSISDGSTSSSELVDDGSSSATSSSSSSSSLRSSDGPLYDFSNLMAQMPIKRGLSKYFEGKCQSFTSLSQVKSVEDLAKKESSYNQRKALIRASKSYGGGLGNHRAYTLPKATISKIKKASSTSRVPIRARGSSVIGMNTLPPVPVRKTH